MSDVTHRKSGLRFEKSQLVEFLPGEKRVDFRGSSWPDEFVRYGRRALVECCLGWRRLTFACSPRTGGRCQTWFGADGKVCIKRWYLSPYVEKPFHSKVKKSFVPELRSRKCFLCFGIPMLYICALWTFWTFYVSVWICLFHIFISGYVTEKRHRKFNSANRVQNLDEVVSVYFSYWCF